MPGRGAIAACAAFAAALLALAPWICRTECGKAPPREICLAGRTFAPERGSFPKKFAQSPSANAPSAIKPANSTLVFIFPAEW